MKKNKVAISIVNWNTAKQLKKCLTSINKNSKDVDVYVVDNDSSDNSVKLVKKEFPNVFLIENKENVGFGKANNQVLKKIRNDFVFIANPDIQLLSNSIQILTNFLESNPEIVACSPLMLNTDKTIQKKGYYHKFPSILQTLLFYTDLYKLSIKFNFLRKKFWETEVKSNEVFEVDQLPGACLFARRDILKEIGFFDEKYVLLFEDVDLSYRIKKLEYKLFVIPDSKIIHEGGASFKKANEVDSQTRFYRGLFLFFDLHKNNLEKLFVRVIIFIELIYLILLVGLKYIYKPTNEKKVFINNKWKILNHLLV